jgi:CheY-like chemotaxis protein
MSQKNFLLVDDDCEDTELFTEAVESVDATVACLNAVHGGEALDQLTSRKIQRPDIIFLDINMPVMNGWQLLDKLKENDELKQIPVIMYSTSSKKSDMKTALSSGALCFFTKPDNYQRLKKILHIIVTYMKNENLAKVCEAIENA